MHPRGLPALRDRMRTFIEKTDPEGQDGIEEFTEAELYWVSPQKSRDLYEAADLLTDSTGFHGQHPCPAAMMWVDDAPLVPLPLLGEVPLNVYSWYTLDDGTVRMTQWLDLRKTSTKGAVLLPNAIGAVPSSNDNIAAVHAWPAPRDMSDADALAIFGPILAAWHFIRTPRLAQVTTSEGQPKERRKAVRNGRPATWNDVNVVDARPVLRQPGNGGEPTGTGTGGQHKVRYEVGAHWHTYRVGPGRQESEKRLLLTYWKGPEDAPVRQTVRALRPDPTETRS